MMVHIVFSLSSTDFRIVVGRIKWRRVKPCHKPLWVSPWREKSKFGKLLQHLTWQKHKEFQGRAEVLLHMLQNNGLRDKKYGLCLLQGKSSIKLIQWHSTHPRPGCGNLASPKLGPGFGWRHMCWQTSWSETSLGSLENFWGYPSVHYLKMHDEEIIF